jgi:hypothetical protein
MPKTKQYREARAYQRATGLHYMQALAAVSTGVGHPPASGGGGGNAAQPSPPPPREPRPPFTVECPSCDDGRLVLGEGDPHCETCGYTASAEDAANEYLESVQGLSSYQVGKDGGDWPCTKCPECNATALITMEPGDSVPNADYFVCFECGERWAEGTLTTCVECGEWKNLGGEIICDDCFDDKVSRDD